MGHLAHDAGLQADEITRKDEVDDLSGAIDRRLVAQPEAAQGGEQLRGVRPLDQDGCPGLDRQLSNLEPLHRRHVLFGHRLEQGMATQRTLTTFRGHDGSRQRQP